MKKIAISLLISVTLITSAVFIINNKSGDNIDTTKESVVNIPKAEKDYFLLSDNIQLKKIENHEDVQRNNYGELKENIENILDDLYSKGFTFTKVERLYEKILEEQGDAASLNEMIMSFFESMSALDLSDSQYDELQKMALDLIDNPKTRSMSIKRASQILDDKQMAGVFEKYKNSLTDNERENLASQYTNFRLMNGKTPFAHDGMKEIYRKSTSDDNHNKKVNAIIGMLSSQDKDQAKRVAKKNFNNDNTWNGKGSAHDYVLWVRVKFLSMSYNNGLLFLINEFNQSDFNKKNEFLISGLDLIELIAINYIKDHIDKLDIMYLQAIYNQNNFNNFNISGILNIFRSVISESVHQDLKNLIDEKIKKSIDTYPTYTGSMLALKIIKEEKIYIESADFDINNYAPEESENNNGKIDKLF